jgi:hypothetical protein
MGERTIWLVTVVAGALGWLFTHTVDRVLASPTIEYEIRDGADSTNRLLVIPLTNVTRDQSFSEVRLTLTASPSSRILAVNVIPTEPASEGDVAPRYDSSSADVVLQNMLPQSHVEVKVRYTGPQRPSIRVSSDESVQFQEAGVQTFFARHEIFILWLGAMGIGTALLLRAAISWWKGSADSEPCNDTQ